MASIPRDSGLDSTVALLREGYAFIPNRWGYDRILWMKGLEGGVSWGC